MVLCELELTIQRVKVMTTPDGRVLDLFFITDNMEILHTKKRQDETQEQLHAVLGESSEELFGYELSDKEIRSQALSPDMSKLKKASVAVDNSLSPAHTLLQIHCPDHKGLLYDIMRTLKDCNIQIAYGRFSPNSMGYRDLDLFIQQKDGKKIVDPEKQSAVANPVKLSGNGRPQVFFDVTLALKSLGTCIFSAEIGRYSTSESDHEWEVYRFLLDEDCRLCELFTFLWLIDMYFYLAFSSSYRFSLGLKGVSFANLGFKGVISFTVFIGNWYLMVSYYCSLAFLLQNAFQGDYIGFITRGLSLYWFGPIFPFDPEAT
ncbi:hypothetical protein CMV_021787 [Castanea mollissima]|uniref:ACT domain-containing protein ACR n=1 Tax=Castanea mollissima TaxID=60419 RepID=A0A8J4QXH0_9ROSI|nr:hypothetical protein CMV_021787 [Castanea mollissima]